MLRKNFIINFGKIEEFAKGAVIYKQELSDLKGEVSSFSSVVEDNSGAAAREMNKDVSSILKYIDQFVDGLEKIDSVLKSYDSEMKGIISPVNNNADMRIATEEIQTSMKQLYNDLESLKSMSSTVTIPTVKLEDNSTQGPLGSLNSTQFALDSIKEIERIKAKQEAVAQTINSICSKYLSDIEKIADKVEKFAEKDSDFEGRLEGLYKEFTDLEWYETDEFKIGVIVVTVVASVISLFTPAAPIGAKILLNLAETVGFSLMSSIWEKEDIESILIDDLNVEVVTQVVTLGLGNSNVKRGFEMGTDYISNPKVKNFVLNHADEFLDGTKEYIKNKITGEDGDYITNILGSLSDGKFDKWGDKASEIIDNIDSEKMEKLKNPLKTVVNFAKEDLKEQSKWGIKQGVDQGKNIIEEGKTDIKKIEKPEDYYFKEDKVEGMKNAVDTMKDDDKIINRFLNRDE